MKQSKGNHRSKAASPVWMPGFALLVMLAAILLVGCSQDMVEDLEEENQALRAKVKELELIIDEKASIIERYENVYELRNRLDIKARQVIAALNSGIFSEIEDGLLDTNVTVKEDRLLFTSETYTTEVFFLQNKLDFKSVRQRFYFLDEQDYFITGYEVMSLSDDVQEQAASRGVLIFTFAEGPSGWKLVDIGTDR